MAVTRQGGIRRPMYQDNNAPRGYGQQNGASSYLDREANNVADALTGGGAYEREPQRYGGSEGAVSTTQPEGPRYGLEEDSQGPDRWGRSLGHPHYGQDPRTVGNTSTGGSSRQSADSIYGGEKAPRSEDYKPGSIDQIRGLLGEEPENGDGTFSASQLGRITGSRQGAAGAQAPEYQDFQYEVAMRGANQPYGTTADDYVAPDQTTSPTLGARSGAEMVTSWGDTSGLRGFNTNEWGQNSPEYDEASIKNNFGKIATRFPHTPDGLRALVQDEEFARIFPGAALVDHPTDPKIDFGDGRPVDVLFQSDKGWQWLTADDVGGGAIGGSATGQAAGSQPSPNAVNNALVGPTVDPNDSAIQALLQQILLGNPEGQQMYNAYQEMI